MRANDPENMDERLAGWIATLITNNRELHTAEGLRSFMGWIAEEDIITFYQLTQLFIEWRMDYNSLR